MRTIEMTVSAEMADEIDRLCERTGMTVKEAFQVALCVLATVLDRDPELVKTYKAAFRQQEA